MLTYISPYHCNTGQAWPILKQAGEKWVSICSLQPLALKLHKNYMFLIIGANIEYEYDYDPYKVHQYY